MLSTDAELDAAFPREEPSETPTPSVAAPSEPARRPKPDRRPEVRWGQKLGSRFTPVSQFFLHNYYRLRPHEGARGLSSTEVMVLIHLMDHKWDTRDPFPTLTLIAKRMDMKVRNVRDTVKRLEDLGYLTRIPSTNGGPNRYALNGLIVALEKLMAEDIAKTDDTATAVALLEEATHG